MILAAGEGRRLRPLTNTTPKPLIEVGGRALVDYHLAALARAGIEEVVVNLRHLGDKIRQSLGAGRHGVEIVYSQEGEVLETGGGIAHALPLLGGEPFLLVSGDVYIEYDFRHLLDRLEPSALAHLLMVPNPAHNAAGDFAISSAGSGRVALSGDRMVTYSGVAFVRPELFRGVREHEATPLREVLVPAIRDGSIGGEVFPGYWMDVGTRERLDELCRHVERNRNP